MRNDIKRNYLICLVPPDLLAPAAAKDCPLVAVAPLKGYPVAAAPFQGAPIAAWSRVTATAVILDISPGENMKQINQYLIFMEILHQKVS